MDLFIALVKCSHHNHVQALVEKQNMMDNLSVIVNLSFLMDEDKYVTMCKLLVPVVMENGTKHHEVHVLVALLLLRDVLLQMDKK